VAALTAGCGSRAHRHDVGRFAGIPQHGAVLGSPHAPFTLVEFVDLQCPWSAAFDRKVLPTVVSRFVRTGQLRIELRTVAFLGPDSAPLSAATTAAGMQDRMWQFADLAFRSQGGENSGYATPAFIASAAGLDITRLSRASGTPELRGELQTAARDAQTARITGTPGFRFGRTGGVLTPFGQGSARWQNLPARIAAAIRRHI
jgi:protein-disulfide isomerase